MSKKEANYRGYRSRVGKITKGMEKALMSGDMRHRRTRDMKEECERVGGCGGPLLECDVMPHTLTVCGIP